MRDKGHCKLQLEGGPHWARVDADEEMESVSPFLAFFDFEKEVAESESKEDALVGVRERREIREMNECLELVRSDGTVIGHREHALAYRQKHAQLSGYRETQSEQQIIAQINNPQRKLQLMQMERQKQRDQFEASGARQQSTGDKGKDVDAMNLQQRQHKAKLENWKNLQRSKQLAFD